MPTADDAFQHIVRCLRGEVRIGYDNYGYDLYLRHAVAAFVGPAAQPGAPEVQELSPLFMAAAWDLCQRGILRPGIRRFGQQSTEDGSAGGGFSLTPFGHQWIREGATEQYVPTEPGRFSEMMAPLAERLGQAMFERAQEAIRCYVAHAWLACCVMCGASAEAIIIAAAVARVGDERGVLRDMTSSGGRGRVERTLTGQVEGRLRAGFQASHDLLKYWRDVSAHGERANVSESEAYTALFLLLRFAHLLHDNWNAFTRTGQARRAGPRG